MKKKTIFLTGFAALTMLSGAASAHTGLGSVEGFAFGLQHPLLGLDHFLVMTGLGLWLSRQSIRYGLWGIAAFLVAMSGGAVLAMSGWYFPHVETAILLSVLLTGGLLMSSAWRLPGVVGLVMIAAVAAMHGHAHGSEMPLHAAVLTYCAGFLLATLSLMVAGVGCGWFSRRWRLGGFSRLYGSLTGMAGLWLLLNS